MRKKDLQVLYENASVRRALAEVKAIAARREYERADHEYSAAVEAEMQAADAWRAAPSFGTDAGQPVARPVQ